LKFNKAHLSYCTNIHPAETWAETFNALQTHVLAVRDRLIDKQLLQAGESFAIGLRLSAIAAEELLVGDKLLEFKQWLEETNTYVFTINGFPFGSFHGTRVKEQVFKPDWTAPARLEYTKNLFRILSVISKPGSAASVSTLPGSHKTFFANEKAIMSHLIELADWLDQLSLQSNLDLHLGLEPEPLGHFENTKETLGFFKRLQAAGQNVEAIHRRIGVNYDACHFALEYDDARASLDELSSAGIRISKIHLSSALALDPRDPSALQAIRQFDEPVYFHQVLLRRDDLTIERLIDLPALFSGIDAGTIDPALFNEMRVHFHIPLDAEPLPPLRSTRDQTVEVLHWKNANPDSCNHYEIETYTWGVLPEEMQRPVEEQIAEEYKWVLSIV
jgi:hypothetical protein